MSTTHQQITKAIGAHGMWKARLQKAIDDGASDLSVTAVREDKHCDFGKWLYGAELSADIKASQHYEQCRRLHRDFHLAASKVLALALANKKSEALSSMRPEGEFGSSSGSLTKAMMDWDREVH